VANTIITATISAALRRFVALEGVDFHVQEASASDCSAPTARAKSTLVNCLTGTLRNDTGEIVFLGERIENLVTHHRIRRGHFGGPSRSRGLSTAYRARDVEISLMYAGSPRRRWNRFTTKAERILDQIGLRAKADEPVQTVTQSICASWSWRAPWQRAQAVIADEAIGPACRMPRSTRSWTLLMKLNDSGISIVMIEHIMYAVMKFSQRICVLVAGARSPTAIRKPWSRPRSREGLSR